MLTLNCSLILVPWAPITQASSALASRVCPKACLGPVTPAWLQGLLGSHPFHGQGLRPRGTGSLPFLSLFGSWLLPDLIALFALHVSYAPVNMQHAEGSQSRPHREPLLAQLWNQHSLRPHLAPLHLSSFLWAIARMPGPPDGQNGGLCVNRSDGVRVWGAPGSFGRQGPQSPSTIPTPSINAALQYSWIEIHVFKSLLVLLYCNSFCDRQPPPSLVKLNVHFFFKNVKSQHFSILPFSSFISETRVHISFKTWPQIECL